MAADKSKWVKYAGKVKQKTLKFLGLEYDFRRDELRGATRSGGSNLIFDKKSMVATGARQQRAAEAEQSHLPVTGEMYLVIPPDGNTKDFPTYAEAKAYVLTIRHLYSVVIIWRVRGEELFQVSGGTAPASEFTWEELAKSHM